MYTFKYIFTVWEISRPSWPCIHCIHSNSVLVILNSNIVLHYSIRYEMCLFCLGVFYSKTCCLTRGPQTFAISSLWVHFSGFHLLTATGICCFTVYQPFSSAFLSPLHVTAGVSDKMASGCSCKVIIPN